VQKPDTLIGDVNLEWLCANSEQLKQLYNNKWVIIEDQKVVNVADTVEESVKAYAKCKKDALYQFITTEPVEYIFFR